MAIDWASDDFARLFKRETDDDLLLSWEALAAWHMFLKKCDKSGLIETKRGVRGLSAVLRIPLEVLDRVLEELLEDGRIRNAPDRGFYAPNYARANYTARTPGSRQADARIRSAITMTSPHGAGSSDACDGLQNGVTSSHMESRGVTSSHVVDPISDQIRTAHIPRVRAGRGAISSDWKPRDREVAMAAALGLDVDEEAKEFLDYWLADGRAKKDWDQAFANRLDQQSKRNGKANGHTRKVEDL